ncbi:32727_t:CDS:2, partial [Gigaspora margarita]
MNFFGQLDLLNALSEYINDQKTLFNMIMISRNCARVFIPILWNDPFSSLFDCEPYCGTILHYLKGLKGESLVLCKGSLIDFKYYNILDFKNIKIIDCDYYSKNSMIEACNLNTQLTLVEYDLMNYRKKILESIGKKNQLNVIIHMPCSENLK